MDNSIPQAEEKENTSFPFLPGDIEWFERAAVRLKEELILENKPNQNACGGGNGCLPGACAPLAFPYVPMQENNPARYDQKQALASGTLFPGLNLPFHKSVNGNLSNANTALGELMALDFAIDELGLYLTTHPQDQEVLDLYWTYIRMGKEGREKYQKMYGPLMQTDITEDEGYAWLKNPWPWDVGGND